jgi:hypothetical protein
MRIPAGSLPQHGRSARLRATSLPEWLFFRPFFEIPRAFRVKLAQIPRAARRGMARKPAQSAIDAQPTHQSIAADIATFREQGGRIEVLGNTPLRAHPSSPFRSSPEQRKPPTPVKRRASR